MASTEVPTSVPPVAPEEMPASYIKEPREKLGVLARNLLENYSKIPPEEVESHVKKIVKDPSIPERPDLATDASTA
jgi:hypothetical protein